MTEAFKREKVFRDPVHDYIHVQHPIILELINSRELQRLRRIKQTGASMYTFHTAEHSRFSHSSAGMADYDSSSQALQNRNNSVDLIPFFVLDTETAVHSAH